MSLKSEKVDPAVEPTPGDGPEYRDWYNTKAAKKKSSPRNIGDEVAVVEDNNIANGLRVHEVKEGSENGRKVMLYQLVRKNGKLYNDGDWYAQDLLLDDD